MEKYFNRPKELDKMRILSFFSKYSLSISKLTNQERIDQIKRNYGETSEIYINPSRLQRPPNSLRSDSRWDAEKLSEFNNIDFCILLRIYLKQNLIKLFSI